MKFLRYLVVIERSHDLIPLRCDKKKMSCQGAKKCSSTTFVIWKKRDSKTNARVKYNTPLIQSLHTLFKNLQKNVKEYSELE